MSEATETPVSAPHPAATSAAAATGTADPGGKAEALKTIAGLLAVVIGLMVLGIIALAGMGWVKTDNPSVVSIATGSFGVIGTIVGAYFGVKVGNDNTQKAIDNTTLAINGIKDEASKAQAFAAHVDPANASAAVAEYQRLRVSAPGPDRAS